MRLAQAAMAHRDTSVGHRMSADHMYRAWTDVAPNGQNYWLGYSVGDEQRARFRDLRCRQRTVAFIVRPIRSRKPSGSAIPTR